VIGRRTGSRERPDAPAHEHGRVLFVAVPVTAPARDKVAALVAALPVPTEERPVRWVRFDGLHLTLRFLGPTPDERIPAIEAAMAAAAAGERPFRVSLGGAGAFPSTRRPRAIWLGIAGGIDELVRIARHLEDALVAAGWPRDERPFRAHLTLARSDGVRAGPATASALVAAARGFTAEFEVDRLVLFESRTGGGPARYEPVAERLLGDRGVPARLPSTPEAGHPAPPPTGKPDRP
jgi:2'-5' RNA ligase